jgi:hypothetical protein
VFLTCYSGKRQAAAAESYVMHTHSTGVCLVPVHRPAAAAGGTAQAGRQQQLRRVTNITALRVVELSASSCWCSMDAGCMCPLGHPASGGGAAAELHKRRGSSS